MKITEAAIEAARHEFHMPPCGNRRWPCCDDPTHRYWMTNEHDCMKRAIAAALRAMTTPARPAGEDKA